MKDWLEIWILLGAIAIMCMFDEARAGPLREPAQCRVFWINIEKVESWSAQRKNELYWQCLARTMEWRKASQLTVEEAVKLREAWALSPAPEMQREP